MTFWQIIAVAVLLAGPANAWVHGVAMTTFDPAHKIGINLTDGNLTATATSGGQVRSTSPVLDGGQVAVTFVLAIANGVTAVGLVNALYTFTGGALGVDDNSIGFYNNGTVVRNGVVLATIDPFIAADTVTISVNRTSLGSISATFGDAGDPSASIDLSDWGTGPVYGAAQVITTGDQWASNWSNWPVP